LYVGNLLKLINEEGSPLREKSLIKRKQKKEKQFARVGWVSSVRPALGLRWMVKRDSFVAEGVGVLDLGVRLAHFLP
jgi:hypothetical protein